MAHKGDAGIRDGQTPRGRQIYGCSLRAVKGGANGSSFRQMHARGSGCKDERQILVGGVCGRSSGGKRYVLGKEVGCRREREVLQQRPLLMRVGRREGNKTI